MYMCVYICTCSQKVSISSSLKHSEEILTTDGEMGSFAGVGEVSKFSSDANSEPGSLPLLSVTVVTYVATDTGQGVACSACPW